MIKKSLCLTLLLSSSAGFAVAPYFSIRSQSENIARELVGAGWNTQINLCCMDERYVNFSITPEFTRSFRPCDIAQCLFGCSTYNCGSCGSGNSICNTGCSPCGSCGPCYDPCCDDCYRIRITGSLREDRNANDWLADYFGLPTDYKSFVTFEPRIDNFLVDFNFYVGMDEWCKGMYFRVHAPVVHTRWDLNMCEHIEDAGVANHWPGYFNKWYVGTSPNFYGIPRANLVSSFASFISGCGTINLAGLNDGSNNAIRNDIVFNPLCHAKMDCCRRTKTAFADLQMALGWNIWCDDCYHAGFNIRAAAPTGNRPEGCYLFEPIVGNGKHWELGAGLTSHWCFWQDECECRSMAFYLDANVTHLFKSKQCRTFDLCSKPLSRYMLAAKFKTPVNELETEGNLVPVKQFAGIYSPVANLTTIPVDVSVGVQGDLAFMLQYVHNNWSFDIGYNFWGTSCEKIEFRCDCGYPFEQDTWALKGDAFMYGFASIQVFPLILSQPGIALSPSQSKATICKGTNNPPDGIDGVDWARNPGVDNRIGASSGSGNPLFIYTDIGNSANAIPIYTSRDPVFISVCDVDLCGARTKGRSHKLFINFDYTWCDNECWVPYLGIGMEAEFAQKPCDDWCGNNCGTCKPYGTCDNTCNPCRNTSCQPCQPACCGPCCDSSCCCTCGVSQWGIWIKGGFAYY